MTTRASVIITETGLRSVTQGFKQAERQVDRFGKKGATAGRMVSRSMTGLVRGIGRLTTVAGGLGLAFGAKNLLDFDRALGQLQAKAKLTNKEAAELRAEILRHNQAVTLGKDAYLRAATTFQDFGGRLKEGRALMGFLGEAAHATSTEISDLAKIAAAMSLAGKGPDEIKRTIAALNAQADAGTVAMSDMARVFPEISKQGELAGQSLLGMGRAMQVVGVAMAGNAERSKFAILAMMRDLKRNEKVLRTMGIEVFADASKTSMRDINQLLLEVMQKTGGRLAGKGSLQSVFSAEGLGAASAYAGTGGATLRTVRGAEGGDVLGLIGKQLELRRTGIDAQGEKLRGAMAKVEVQFLNLGKQLATFIAANPAKALGIAAGGYAGIKILPRLVGRLFGRGRGGGGAAGLLGAAGGRGVPVYVTNLPGAGLGGGGAAGPGGARGPKRTIAQKIGRGAAALGAFGAGYTVGTSIDEATGASDYLSTLARGGAGPAATVASTARDKQLATVALTEQATALAGLSQRGLTTFGTAEGTKELTQANVLAQLQKQGAQVGLGKDVMDKLYPVLLQLTRNIGNMKVVVSAPGVDNPKVSQKRQVTR